MEKPARVDAGLGVAFESILPRVRSVARRHFRHLSCPARRDDAVAEVTAVCWKWFVRLKRKGKDPETFPVAFATLAARAVRSGRRLCGQERAKDAMSLHCRSRRGFTVSALHDDDGEIEDALRDNTRTPVPEQVQFRHDFPAWLGTLSARDRAVLGQMALGHRTLDLAARFGLSPSRVSQLRLAFKLAWDAFGSP